MYDIYGRFSSHSTFFFFLEDLLPLFHILNIIILYKIGNFKNEREDKIDFHFILLFRFGEICFLYFFWNQVSSFNSFSLDLKAYSSTQHSPHELSIITLIDFKNREKLSRKSKISFELFKQLREVHIMVCSSF